MALKVVKKYYTFSDESGTPGTAANKNDWFLVGMVFFDSEENLSKLKTDMARLRRKLGLPADYEFHHVDDSKQIRQAFYHLLARTDFRYMIFAIKKIEDGHFASEITMANLIMDTLGSLGRVKLVLDVNHKLYAKLGKAKKAMAAKKVNLREEDSKKENLLQVADYIASYGIARVKKKVAAFPEDFARLEKKCMAEIIRRKN